MKYRSRLTKLLSRISGVSTPILGINWDNRQSSRLIARSTLLFLEDRRVLYSTQQAHVVEWCIASILEIRQFLTRQIEQVHHDERLQDDLRAMRTACREFLIAVPNTEGDREVFYEQIHIMQRVLRQRVCTIVRRYHLEVEADFERLLGDTPDGSTSSR